LAGALRGLAPHFPESLLPEALAAARGVRNEGYRAKVLSDLAPYLPEILPEALAVARAIGNEYFRAEALKALTAQLTPANVDLSFWQDVVRLWGLSLVLVSSKLFPT
ncbi:MAG: hypothetical protein ACKO90_26035, partial [Microcystis panniformis]